MSPIVSSLGGFRGGIQGVGLRAWVAFGLRVQGSGLVECLFRVWP